MAKPLDGQALETYFRRLGFKEETQDLIKLIRSSPPSRNPRGSKGNVCVWYPSQKMGCIIKAESHTVEFPRLLVHEYSKNVFEYYDQPPPIRLEYLDKHGHKQTPWHTPDFFVIRYKSAGWEECKPTQELIRQARERPNRYKIDENGKWRCPPGEEYAKRFGLTYRVYPSDDINWAAHDNWLYLEEYYQDLEKLTISDEALQKLRRIVEETPGISLVDLALAAEGVSVDEINVAIAKHDLYVDLLAHRLSDRKRRAIPVYLDKKTAYDHSYKNKDPRERGNDHSIDIKTGSIVSWDGKEWQIANVGETEITLVDDGKNPFPLVWTAFEALAKKGKIIGVHAEPSPSFLTEAGQEKQARARECDLQAAVYRNRVIHPEDYDDDEQKELTEKIAKEDPRKKRYWCQLYQEGEVKYGSGFIGLIPDYVNCGGVKLPLAVRNLIEEVLNEYYDTTTRKHKRGAYGEYILRSKKISLPTVSQTTFYAWVKRHRTVYDQIYLREGARAAYPYKDYFRSSQRTTNRHGNHAWAGAHIDHMLVDLELFDSETGKNLGKCWLTLMLLSNPIRIAAVYLSFDPPSYRSCLAVIRLCVKRFNRLPQSITVDGGSEFRSTYFEKLLALFRVRKQQRPASEPRYGAPLEKLYGTANTDFIHQLLGNTQASKNPRTNTKATDPKRLGVWTLAALAEQANQWAFEEYDKRIHTTLKQSPREAYERSMEQHGRREHKFIPYDDDFIKETFPTTQTGKAVMHEGVGVRIKYLDYWCEEMGEVREGIEVRVCYDPFDISIGYAYINKQWRVCHATCEEMVGCSERERQILTEEIRKMNRNLHGREHIEINQASLAEFRRENAAKEKILRQQRNERETKAALAVLEGEEPTHQPTPASSIHKTSMAAFRKNTGPKSSLQNFTNPDQDKLIIFKRHR
jgi:putative transposase